MKDKILILFFITFCALIGLLQFGCSKENKIKFYRESATTDITHNTKETEPKKDSITRTNGMVIYKDNSGDRDNGQTNIKFGPKDMNFDLPIKSR